MLFPLLGWTLLSGVFTRPVVEASVLNHHRPALSSGYSSAHSVQSPPWAGFDLDTNYYERIPNTGVVREFWFDIVNTTAAPDGIEREVLLVNGQFPGPTIEANWGDTIKVHVRNSMQNNGSAIHFHGVRQLYSNQMDGVQSLTQCPIAPGSNYTYTWRAEQYGSSWYHSHFSLQAWEGVLGGIVIHGPATAEYDEDLGIMMLNDWSRLTADQLYQSQLENGFSSPQMNGGLLNGTNTYIKDDGTSVGKRFKVESTPGKRYRLRLVNAAIHTHFKFSIDNHKMLVIANDFVPLEPFEVDYLPIGMGQRYDIIIEANQPIDNYWMRAVPQEACSNNTASENIKGILHYTGADAASEPASTKWNYADDLWCEDVPAKKLVPRLAIDPLISHATTFGDSIGLAPTGDPTLYLWTVGGQTFNVSWNNPTLLQTSESKYKTYGIEQGAIEINTPNQWTVFVIQTELPVPHPIHLHGSWPCLPASLVLVLPIPLFQKIGLC